MSHCLREALQLPGEVRQTINYGLNRVRFPAPVRADEKIRALVRLQSCRDLSGSVEAVFGITSKRKTPKNRAAPPNGSCVTIPSGAWQLICRNQECLF